MDTADEFRERVLNDLEPLVGLLYYAFDQATAQARAELDEGHEKFGPVVGPGKAVYDPYLFSHIVRHWVHTILSQRGYVVDVEGYNLRDLPNSGLALSAGEWNIRIRKSNRGMMPDFGQSAVMLDFIAQPLFPDEGLPFGRNFVILWHSSFEGDFLGLSLVYFRNQAAMAGGVDFRVDFGDPVLFVPAAQAPDIEIVEETFEPVLEDLPYEVDLEAEAEVDDNDESQQAQ